MNFKSESAAYEDICETIIKSSATLYNVLKYIYAAADSEFYKVKAKDIIRVGLSNLLNAENLNLIGIRPDDNNCKEMRSPEYEEVLQIIIYSIAVRMPLLKKVTAGGDSLTDSQVKEIYRKILLKGAKNVDNIVDETFDDYRKYMRSNDDTPAYNSDFYKTFIFKNIPSLAEINNKNLYILGVSDVVFPLFWYSFEDVIEKTLAKHI